MEIVPERCGIEGRGVGTEGGEGGRTHTGEGFIRIESGLPDGSSGSERAEQGEKCLVADARNAGEGEKPGGVRKSLMVGDDIHACFGHHTRMYFIVTRRGNAYGQSSGFGYTIEVSEYEKGPIAHLVERLLCTQEASGPNPLGSTTLDFFRWFGYYTSVGLEAGFFVVGCFGGVFSFQEKSFGRLAQVVRARH